jgi:hypothetical protein
MSDEKAEAEVKARLVLNITKKTLRFFDQMKEEEKPNGVLARLMSHGFYIVELAAEGMLVLGVSEDNLADILDRCIDICRKASVDKSKKYTADKVITDLIKDVELTDSQKSADIGTQ